ncbi:MAG TPA: BamA/TamA family outer membrane protein [Gemmatales bacterium]|nr:BamA/TamA family outer membrane protein [Gemmatales bacterium]HMP59244.1 BamA/TamA family outer membrane protein [Gemmatales bacterium]
MSALLAGNGVWRRLGRGHLVLWLWLIGLTCTAWADPPIREGTLVTEVRVVGCRRHPEAAVLNEIQTRKGKPYNRAVVQADTRLLDNSHRYAIGVIAEEHIQPEGVAIVFRVVERATIQEVIYDGFKHLDNDELHAATGLRKGMPMSVSLNRRGQAALQRLYESKGYLFANIELVEGTRDDDLRVVYRVTQGPKVKVKDIEFEGNSFVTAGRLKTQIDTEARILGLFGGTYNPAMLDHDLGKLLEYYRNFGFFDCKIRREVRWNPGFETVNVVFVIEEGQRFLVTGVDVVGNRQLDKDRLMTRNVVKVGEPFNGRYVQASQKLIQGEYGRTGYINTFVRPEMRFDDERAEVQVQYQVAEAPLQAYVGEIKVIGNSVTRDNVIRRQLQFFPGQLLSEPDLRASENNLARLGIFKNEPEQGIAPTVTILDPDGPSPFKDVLVEVHEDRTGSLMFGVGINSDAGATASVVLNERNFDILRVPTSWDDVWSNRAFRGAGQEFRAEIVPGNLIQRYSVAWREPFLLDSPYSLGLTGYYLTRIFNEYYESRLGGRMTVGHRFTPLWSASISGRAEDVNVRSVSAFAPQDYLDVLGRNAIYAPRVALTRDSRDSFLRPTEGNLFELAYEQGLGDYTFPILTAEDNQYFTLYERPDGSGRHVLQLRAMVGWSGDDTPVFERFFAGGIHTIRGFDFRGVGPDERGFKLGGNFMFIGSVEYQIPLIASDKVFAVVFSDFGTVESNVEIRDFRVSVGAGLRLIVPMFGPLPIALDWAYPLAKKESDDRRLFNFSVGFIR